jgi:hypothetical protein
MIWLARRILDRLADGNGSDETARLQQISPTKIADNSSGFVSILKVSLCLDQPHDRIAK